MAGPVGPRIRLGTGSTPADGRPPKDPAIGRHRLATLFVGTVSQWTPPRWVQSLSGVLPVKQLSPASDAPPPTQTAVIAPVPPLTLW